MPLRVLHVFGQYLHDTENWSYRLIRDLPNCKIVVGAERFLKCNFYDPRFEFIEFPFRPYDWPRPGFFDRTLNAFIHHILLPLYPRWLARQVAPVDLVHAHFGFIGWHYVQTARRLRAPLVVSFYGADYHRLPNEQPVWRERYRQLFAEAALVLCEGRHGANEIIKLGCPMEKVAVQHLGVDTAAIARAARPKKAGELRLVQIATFREKKGHLYTAQAFREALADCPNMTLTFVGHDVENLRCGVEDALGEAKSHVQFLNTVDFHTLHGFLADFQVFIHPSVRTAHGDCEGGAPVVLLDAQATGMPVIATRHCDIPEEVRDGETGVLVDEKDVPGLAAAIRRFYAMAQREYDEFSTRAAAHVTAEYDAARNAAVLRTRYDALRCCGPSHRGYTPLANVRKCP